MKTQFSRRRNALVSSATLLTGGVVFLIAVVVTGISFFFPTLSLALAEPGWKLGAAASTATHSLSSFFTTHTNSVSETERLLNENQTLQNENRALRAQLHDIASLTDGATLSQNRVTASVRAGPPLSPYDTLVVSLTALSSVPTGAIVYGPGSVPIGTVTESGLGTARVSLYSSPHRKVEGWIGEKRFPVTLTGESAGAFSATLARESGVVPGDVLYLPGPGALPAGTVARLVSDPSSTSDVVYIVPYVNIFSLSWVAIETGP